MSEEKTVLTYKGHPLMRKDNLIYYGSMADSHIIMLQILNLLRFQDLQHNDVRITYQVVIMQIEKNLCLSDVIQNF